MNDRKMTKKELLEELAELRQKNTALELALEDQNRISSVSKDLVSIFSEQPQTVTGAIDYHFSDLVDIKLMGKLFKSLYEVTGISSAIVDIDNKVLSGIAWQDICTRFHRVCPQTECRCQQSDSYILTHLQDGPYVGYSCLNGLMDYATPIIIEGQHLATIFHGQLMHTPPDEAFFRRQAQAYGFDEAAYIEALQRVPIIPKNQIASIMNFSTQLSQFIATMGLERKRQLETAAQATIAQEEKLKLVLDASTDGFWDWNIATGDLYYSSRWAVLLGYPPEEIAPHIDSWKKLLHPDDIGAALKALIKHLDGETPKYESQYRMLTKSGKWQWIMGRGQVVARNKEGRPLRMVGSYFDLTERKLAEASLVQSEDKFAKIFRSNPDIMTISTLKEGRYVDVNDAYVEIVGYEQHEAIGHTVEELKIWPVPAQRELIVAHIEEHRHIRGLELDFRRKSGEIRTVILSGELIEIDNEPHLLSVLKDITDRKQMEEALRSSEECFSKAFNAAPISMCITTLAEGKIIDINDNYCRLLGYAREEVLGLASFELKLWGNPEDRNQVKEKLMRMESVSEMEVLFRMKSAELRLGLYSAERLTINGETCVLSMLMDITERKQIESEMTRLGQLNLVGEMAASIAHEIRNPMTTVRGYLQILRENENYNQEIEHFDLMIEEMDRANLIITEFLSLAKNKTLELKPGNLNLIIRTLMPLVQANAKTLDQYIRLELDDLPNLLLDSKEISQLIVNLVNNALESMPLGGDVTIKTFIENGKVVLAVQDQGHGIDYESLDKLGTPFFTTKDQGVGLGLAACYRIASRHNAKIDLETSSTGTTFFVRFASQLLVNTNS